MDIIIQVYLSQWRIVTWKVLTIFAEIHTQQDGISFSIFYYYETEGVNISILIDAI